MKTKKRIEEKKKKKKNKNNNTNVVVVILVRVLYDNRKMSTHRKTKKQKIIPITIEITVDKCIECNGCESKIYQLIEDYFFIECEQHHSFCTACFANKEKQKGCDHRLQFCCGKRNKTYLP